ncbi:MAG: hypothetical protein PHN79_08235, partial [Methanoregula sp.]|nr:hypothetical protein [Methanoregula sp.]
MLVMLDIHGMMGTGRECPENAEIPEVSDIHLHSCQPHKMVVSQETGISFPECQMAVRLLVGRYFVD